MSTLLQLIRSQAVKTKLTFLRLKDTQICNKAYRRHSSGEKVKQAEPYEACKNWASYGFDYDNKTVDRHTMHITLFISITVCLVSTVVGMAYLPDPLLKEWAQREAFLQLRYREENGLPVIDPNLIDPSKFRLPTDDELGYTDIII